MGSRWNYVLVAGCVLGYVLWSGAVLLVRWFPILAMVGIWTWVAVELA